MLVMLLLLLLMRILMVLVLVPLPPLTMLLLVIKVHRTWLSVIRAPRSFSDSSNGVFIPIAPRALPIHVQSEA